MHAHTCIACVRGGASSSLFRSTAMFETRTPRHSMTTDDLGDMRELAVDAAKDLHDDVRGQAPLRLDLLRRRGLGNFLSSQHHLT